MQARKTTKHLAAGAVALALLLGTVPPILWAQQEKPIRAVTPQQKEHSKRYNNLGHSKLTGRADTGELTVGRGRGLRKVSTTPITIHPTEFLAERACGSSAVVIGTLTEETPLLNEDETFVFTEHLLQVEEILKDNPASLIPLNSHITVIRPGGVLEINGLKVTATLVDFRPFRIGGRYLLYLKFIPVTGAYEATTRGSFELRGNRYIKHIDDQFWSDKTYRVEDAVSFLALAHSSVTGPCIGKSK